MKKIDRQYRIITCMTSAERNALHAIAARRQDTIAETIRQALRRDPEFKASLENELKKAS